MPPPLLLLKATRRRCALLPVPRGACLTYISRPIEAALGPVDPAPPSLLCSRTSDALVAGLPGLQTRRTVLARAPSRAGRYASSWE
eukprot:scaffold8103_cov403-Prasinococcus_capsulatus_cf.AAC.4